MIKNFFKIALRNLWRSKGFSIINIFGLAIGMASAIAILLVIQNEMSYDLFHKNKDVLYEAYDREVFDADLHSWNTTPKILAPTLKQDYPEIENTTRVNWGNSFLFTLGEKHLTAEGTCVDPAFLTMFSFPLEAGNVNSALSGIYSITLTESFAKRLFGNEDPMGKTIKLDNRDNFTVKAVMKDLPNNTRFKFDYLLPWSYMDKRGWSDSNWDNNSTQTFVQLKSNATLANVNEKIKNVIIKHLDGKEKIEIFLHPARMWHLYTDFEKGKVVGGEIETVRMFGIIAAFILLIACINFMNLSTARSEKRAKEVGIRKVVGAQKQSLIGQFICESGLLAFIAGIIALGIVQLCLPAFNTLIEKELHVGYNNIYFWIAAISFVLFTGMLAGSYPAFYLSSFQPVKVLKGTFKAAHAAINPRKVLVVVQFTFAIILIICTIIVERQINYGQERQVGYAKDNLIYHFITGDIEKNYKLIKQELLSGGTAVSVSKTSAPLTEGWSNTWGMEWTGKDLNDKTIFNRFCEDEDLVKTAGFTLLEGRDIDLKDYPSDSLACLVNESAVKHMKLKNPVGQILKTDGNNWHIVGVIKDFILQSPYRPLDPMFIEGSKGWFNVIHIKFNHNRSTAQNLQAAEKIFKKYNPEYPFEYKFIDQEYAKKFADTKRIGTLIGLFASLTIFISCLGLFGLATYMAENRIKEIGVRKVLGASVLSIASLLSKEFLILVLISILIASPVAWFAMFKWLSNYEYRISIQWWIFIVAGLLSMLISLATVSFQAIKAAVANPAKSLRTE
ncbi:MAG TPA: ABC transporter permease [Puia sp.]|nr:ABC transporter permease [Puia sp.]